MMWYGEAGPGPKGTVMSVTFELDGQEFILGLGKTTVIQLCALRSIEIAPERYHYSHYFGVCR